MPYIYLAITTPDSSGYRMTVYTFDWETPEIQQKIKRNIEIFFARKKGCKTNNFGCKTKSSSCGPGSLCHGHVNVQKMNNYLMMRIAVLV